MNKRCVVTKVIKQTLDGYMLAVKELGDKKSHTMHGNVPLFYSGMFAGFETDGNKITDYEVEVSSRNTSILGKNLPDGDIGDYYRRVDLHKELNTGNDEEGKPVKILWREMDLGYGKLPFAKADRIAMHKNIAPYDKSRLNFINKLILKEIRLLNRPYFSIDDYTKLFRKIESKGCFNPLTIATLMDCLSKEPCFGFGKTGLYDREFVQAENFIKKTMKERLDNTLPFMSEGSIAKYLSSNAFLIKEQKEVVKRVLNSREPSFIIGGAGTG